MLNYQNKFMNNYKIIDLLSVLLKRELLYQNNYICIQDVKFYPTSIVLLERDSDIEFTSMNALYTFLYNCLPTTPLRTDRDSLALNREFKSSCMLEEPKELIILSINQLQEQMKITQKKAKEAKEVKEQSTFLRQKEATELYNASRHKVRRLGEKQTDSNLFYKDEEGTPFYSTALLDANFEKKAIVKAEEKRENKVVGIQVNGKEIYKAVEKATEPTKEERMKAKLGIDSVGFDVKEWQERTDKALKVKKGEVKDFTPNDDETGEYCQIESSDIDLLEKAEIDSEIKELEEFSKALNNCEIENHNQEENNQENSKEILFYKTIFFNFEDLQFTQQQLMKWQKRTSEDTPLSADEKDKFSLFIQSVRAYSQFMKITQNQKIEK